MITNITAKKYSRLDLIEHIKNLGISIKAVIKVVKVKNVFCVVFHGSWGKACRFVSISKLALTKLQRTIERAREVIFVPNTNTTYKGHTVDMMALNCTCEAFQDGSHTVYIEDRRVCKHIIAKAKENGIPTISKFKEYIKGLI